MIVNRYNAKWDVSLIEDGVCLYFAGRVAPAFGTCSRAYFANSTILESKKGSLLECNANLPE